MTDSLNDSQLLSDPETMDSLSVVIVITDVVVAIVAAVIDSVAANVIAVVEPEIWKDFLRLQKPLA